MECRLLYKSKIHSLIQFKARARENTCRIQRYPVKRKNAFVAFKIYFFKRYNTDHKKDWIVVFTKSLKVHEMYSKRMAIGYI